MDINVKCFASARELLQRSELVLTLADGATIDDVERAIRALSPELGKMPFMLAHNKAYPEAGTPVREGDELAIIPPVSGG
ncbi:MoaD/ThiS family protein [Prosthecochloris vibrioformis]|uniref:Molybdopterin synthase sulfur carrier subunit n=1 Tax=Prosthecochloris vibrioformis TaxID=1098 RepID=A0A5C4S2N3_PROVB|nr:MoaD/ThiS family protein [Prosthecochloris vibrioformis]TNJ37750.1 MoaD/ThiS family protein [Prosthecochloris vibrioformis]